MVFPCFFPGTRFPCPQAEAPATHRAAFGTPRNPPAERTPGGMGDPWISWINMGDHKIRYVYIYIYTTLCNGIPMFHISMFVTLYPIMWTILGFEWDNHRIIHLP